jgi:exopolyphosphatase/guanosine-5'-triphosphate,3'-diphosphate pyrophosphatase
MNRHSHRRIGIIDIGSNSIRLVIYELTPEGAHRVLNECKESARLSERIGTDGVLPIKDIEAVAAILSHFKRICEASGVTYIRAVATAAIRNAANSAEIMETLRQRTSMRIDILSGEEEARYGFLGVINTMEIADGFLVDIGGGSTEVTLFRGRRMLNSVSFPFGSVNTTRQFTRDGAIGEADILAIRAMVERAASAHPWISSNPGLPLIGLGGTVRSLGKIDQRRRQYSLPLAHNYEIAPADMDTLASWLSSLTLAKRKKVDGLSKDRADIIVPGLTILQAIFKTTGASHYVVSGAGLRDGLLYETIMPDQPIVSNVLDAAVRNLLALHSTIPVAHAEQVNRISGMLFDRLSAIHGFDARCKAYLKTASLLYRMGVSIHYYQYSKHTFYMMAHSRIDGLSHREILISALIASFKTKSRIHPLFLAYKDILRESDKELIVKLGALLQLAIALDRSETQPVTELTVYPGKDELQLHLLCRHNPIMELREAASVEKEFQKAWNLKLKIHAGAFSRT